MSEVLITSSVLILALLILRKLFRRTLSRRVQYALWGLVLVRLLVPVSLPPVHFSVLTAARPVERTVTQRITARPVYIPVSRALLTEHPAAPDLAPERAEIPEGGTMWVADTDDTAVQYRRLSAVTVLSLVWAAGSGIAAVFLLAVNGRFWLRLRRARKPYPVEGCPLRVYLVEEGLSSPCLFGLFRPAIYLTPGALSSPERLRHILAHEQTHARHLDQLWMLLRGVCLAVYWFDPLVWWAASAAKTDCELACDEGALARLGEGERIPYGQTLLSLIPVGRPGSPMLAATTMAAGKKQLKERFNRIANPRQVVAAAVAAALLAGAACACTFTGAKTPEVVLPSQPDMEDAVLRSLTGEELRFFNEYYFNGAGASDSHGYCAYSILNQFANPMNLYEKPEDIDLLELLYCEGFMEDISEEELEAVFDFDRYEDLPCPAYKLTTGEIDALLTRYTGLTLAQTNRVRIDGFTYAADFDAYYWMHGDTNYPGVLSFLVGTREGSTVRLYQNSNFGYPQGWYCVTMEEQEDGSYWFVSNQACEKPAIPTPMPAGEPEAVIPLDSLGPYEAPTVTIEPRVGDFDGSYENRQYNWNISGHSVVIYRAADGTINAAIREGETMNVFLTGLSENAEVLAFRDLFGHDGFTVSYDHDGEPGVRYPGVVTDYYYFAEDDTPVLLLRAFDSGVPLQTMALDLDGDGTNELVTSEELFFQRDGRLCRVGLEDAVMDACPGIEYWGSRTWEPYSKCLDIIGYGTADVEWRDIERCLCFDGEQLLLYKVDKPHHDHMVDGIDKYVPEAVAQAARDYVEREVIVPQPDGTWRHAGYQDKEGNYPQETYDDWRIERFKHQYTGDVGGVSVDIWTFNYELHTIDPENVVLAGGKYLTEDDWVSPGYPGCDWLFFQAEGEEYTFLWHDMINDMGPESEGFQEYVLQKLESADIRKILGK